MEATFTPGPWAVWEGHPDVFAVDESTQNTTGGMVGYRGAIAECDPGDIDGISEEEMMANARLIAAAPDLYEAVEAAMSIEQLWKYPNDVSEEHRGEAEAINSMRQKFLDALSKARGAASEGRE